MTIVIQGFFALGRRTPDHQKQVVPAKGWPHSRMENAIMEKTIQSSRRNPVATAPILHKGGAHQKSKTAERTRIRSQLRRESAEWQRLR